MIAAILRAQLLSMRPGSNRGVALGVMVAVFWYGFWAFVSCWAGLFVSHATGALLRYALPLGLLAVCFYWQAMPVLSASMGSSLDLRKLLIYPAPHRQLFLVELLLRFTTGIEMQMVLAGGAIGLLSNPASGRLSALPSVLAAMVVFVVFNLLLASGTRSLLERLLARRKVREVVALLLAMVWVVPRFLMMSGFKPTWLHAAGAFAGTFAWPWSAAAHAALPLGQSAAVSAESWLALGLWTALAGWFGRSQFERNLRYDALAAQATPLRPMSPRTRRWTERFYRIPSLLWRDPLAAIVEKELRSLARSSRFRMVFVMGFTFGLMLWLPLVLRGRAAHGGAFGHNFLTIVCVYAMTMMGQVTYWNCFGLDRSAAVFYFAAPQPLSQTLAGKNIACLFFVYLEALILTSITLMVHVDFGLGEMLETMIVIGVCATYLMALGNLSSVHYPRALSPERVSQGSGGKRAQAMVMLFYPVVLLPVILAYVARYAFESQVAFCIVLAIAAVIGAVFYRLATDSAVKAASARRQEILEELSQGDGPVTS